jgi:hypothetical protein
MNLKKSAKHIKKLLVFLQNESWLVLLEKKVT